jgi:hypothetical protein
MGNEGRRWHATSIIHAERANCMGSIVSRSWESRRGGLLQSRSRLIAPGHTRVAIRYVRLTCGRFDAGPLHSGNYQRCHTAFLARRDRRKACARHSGRSLRFRLELRIYARIRQDALTYCSPCRLCYPGWLVEKCELLGVYPLLTVARRPHCTHHLIHLAGDSLSSPKIPKNRAMIA